MNLREAKKQLTDLEVGEVEIVEDSMRNDALSRRIRGIVLSSLVVVVGVAVFLTYGFGAIFLALLTLTTLFVSAVEKITYQRRMLHYESVIRKLLGHLEDQSEVRTAPTRRLNRTTPQRASSQPVLVHRRSEPESSASPRRSPTTDQLHHGHGVDSLWSDDSRIARHAAGATPFGSDQH